MLRAELREAVFEVVSPYDCDVEQDDDRIVVRGLPGTSPSEIDLAGDIALLGAGEETEFVSEWLLGRPGALEGLRDLIRQS